ncbi:MAG: nitroreductase family deazaflavin-dependent oxidoreductase [Candidatus Limnocylindrales bacterium]
MSDAEPVLDSPTGNVKRHVRDYLDTDGRIGHRHRGRNTLLLITRGAQSGALRRTALIYGRNGDTFVLVASNAGSQRHPAWYANLRANPSVEVQVEAQRFTATARTASDDERASLWPMMVKEFHMFDRYQEKAARQIPIVILRRDGTPDTD